MPPTCQFAIVDCAEFRVDDTSLRDNGSDGDGSMGYSGGSQLKIKMAETVNDE